MNKFLKNYKRRILAKVWREQLDTLVQKRAAFQAAQVHEEPEVEVSQTVASVPVHPLHVVFDRSYLNKKQTDVSEVEKTKEEIKHVEYHSHMPKYNFVI